MVRVGPVTTTTPAVASPAALLVVPALVATVLVDVATVLLAAALLAPTLVTAVLVVAAALATASLLVAVPVAPALVVAALVVAALVAPALATAVLLIPALVAAILLAVRTARSTLAVAVAVLALLVAALLLVTALLVPGAAVAAHAPGALAGGVLGAGLLALLPTAGVRRPGCGSGDGLRGRARLPSRGLLLRGRRALVVGAGGPSARLALGRLTGGRASGTRALDGSAVLAPGPDLGTCSRRLVPAGRSTRGLSARLAGRLAARLGRLDRVDQLALAHATDTLDAEPARHLLQLREQHAGEPGRAAPAGTGCLRLGGGCGGGVCHVRSFPRSGPTVDLAAASLKVFLRPSRSGSGAPCARVRRRTGSARGECDPVTCRAADAAGTSPVQDPG